MIVLVIAALGLFGGTVWLALDQPVARAPALNRWLTAIGLLLCLAVIVAALIAGTMTLM